MTFRLGDERKNKGGSLSGWNQQLQDSIAEFFCAPSRDALVAPRTLLLRFVRESDARLSAKRMLKTEQIAGVRPRSARRVFLLVGCAQTRPLSVKKFLNLC
jgi:hypothetical protein